MQNNVYAVQNRDSPKRVCFYLSTFTISPALFDDNQILQILCMILAEKLSRDGFPRWFSKISFKEKISDCGFWEGYYVISLDRLSL